MYVGGTKPTNQLIEETKRGQAFPLSPSDGDAFQLTINIPGYDEGIYVYSASASDWILQVEVEDHPYDLALTIYDRPRSNDIVSKFLASRAFIMKANFENSLARANDVSSDTVQFTINKIDIEGTTHQLGFLTFSAGDPMGVFTVNEPNKDFLVMRGETVFLQAPAVRDATLKNVDITMVARLATAGL